MSSRSQPRPGSRIKLLVTSLFVAVAVLLGTNVAIPAPAHAATTNCSWPRCTIELNKEESRNFAYFFVVPLNIPPGPWVGLMYVLWLSHKMIAIGYVNQGKCIKFQLSAAPWESQGMMGYNC